MVHALRGRMDAVLVGRETALRDDPLLTARPPGAADRHARWCWTPAARSASQSRLVRSAAEAPVLVAVGSEAAAADCRRLRQCGCEVLVCPGRHPAARLDALLAELGRRQMTNVLVEGGGRVLGSLLDARHIDEVHVFIAPKLVGGAAAPGPVAGEGVAELAEALDLGELLVESVDGDVYLRGKKGGI